MRKLLMAAVSSSCFAIALSFVQISGSKSNAESARQNNQNNQNNNNNQNTVVIPVGKMLFAGAIPRTLRYAVMNNDGSVVQR